MAFLDRLRSMVSRPKVATWSWFTTLDGGASWTWFQTFTVAWFATFTVPDGVPLATCPTCEATQPHQPAFSKAINHRHHYLTQTRGGKRIYNDEFIERAISCHECNDCQEHRTAAWKAEKQLRESSAMTFADSGGEETFNHWWAAEKYFKLSERVREYIAGLPPVATAAETTTDGTAVTLGTDATGAAITLDLAARNRHVYMIGKTGSGKSSLLRNLIIQDMRAGRGVIYLDPHGDTAEQLLGYVPADRINDVVYFCPTEATCPGFNLLAAPYPPDKLTRDIVSAFRMFFGFDQNSAPRLSQILTNTVLLLLLDREHEQHALSHVRRVLIDPEYRQAIVDRCPHETVKQFWALEFPRYPKDATMPVLNKFSDLLMPMSPMERLFSSTTNAVDLKAIMDGEKILLVNLAKGELGESGAFLIGALIVTAVNQAALGRVRIPEHERRDVFLYVDEFQNFVVDSFESILSEARKYRLNLTLAHQYLAQVPSNLRSAIFGNVAVTVCLPISAEDAAVMYRELAHSSLAIQESGERFDPIPYIRGRAKRFLDGLTLHPNSTPNSIQTGKPWPIHITDDALRAAHNCIWFLDTYSRSRTSPAEGLTTVTWPAMEDFKLLAPLNGFVKIFSVENVHRFTIHHPSERPNSDTRREIITHQRVQHVDQQQSVPSPITPQHQTSHEKRASAETIPADDPDDFLT